MSLMSQSQVAEAGKGWSGEGLLWPGRERLAFGCCRILSFAVGRTRTHPTFVSRSARRS